MCSFRGSPTVAWAMGESGYEESQSGLGPASSSLAAGQQAATPHPGGVLLALSGAAVLESRRQASPLQLHTGWQPPPNPPWQLAAILCDSRRRGGDGVAPLLPCSRRPPWGGGRSCSSVLIAAGDACPLCVASVRVASVSLVPSCPCSAFLTWEPPCATGLVPGSQ